MKFIDSARIDKRLLDATKTLCLPGAKITHILSEITSLSKTYNVNKIVIHVGGNHIPHAIITKLKDMIKEIISIMPETKLYYSLILPRISENYLNGINEINNAISTFCNKIKVDVIQHTAFCNNGEINYNLLRKDAIHPHLQRNIRFRKKHYICLSKLEKELQ